MKDAEVELVTMQMDDVHPLHPLMRGGRKYEEPRPDLAEDSNLWIQTIIRAEEINYEFAKALWDMRSYGTRIGKSKSGYYLYPEIDDGGAGERSVWIDKEMYEQYRDKLLGPYRRWMQGVFNELFEWKS